VNVRPAACDSVAAKCLKVSDYSRCRSFDLFDLEAFLIARIGLKNWKVSEESWRFLITAPPAAMWRTLATGLDMSYSLQTDLAYC
jgi:hypothetical protein